MVMKSLDMAAPLQRTLEMARHHAHAGSLGIMAVLAVSGSVIVLLSLGRPLAERKLGGRRKKAGPAKACGVKAILPAPALAPGSDENYEECSEPRATMEDCRPAEKDVYESVVVKPEAADNSNDKENTTPPKKCRPVLKPSQSSRTRPKAPTKATTTHKSPAEKAVLMLEPPKAETLKRDKEAEELASLSDWNQASEGKTSSLVPEAAAAPCEQKAMNVETPPSTCLLFVGSFRTKGNQQAQAVCLEPTNRNHNICPYCSSPLSSAFDTAAKRKTSGKPPPCQTQQLQSNIRSLGLRTMAKRIGPDPKIRDSSTETRRSVHASNV